jgi:hypothetical protein
MSHQTWQAQYDADPSEVGSSFIVEGHPLTVIGITPPGFLGESLRGDPPDLWIPVQHEPLIAGDSALLRQSVGAWLRIIGRLHPGASTAGPAPRFTGILRQWMQHDSGYPANWMADVIRMLPKQVINVVPAGAGVAIRYPGMSDEQFERHALEVLGRELGADGLARFLRLHRSGPGDYTKDRMQWQKNLTIQEVLDSIKHRRHG